MKKISALLLIILFPLLAYSQVVKSGDVFRSIYVFKGKVVFVKEVQPTSSDLSVNFSKLRNWANINFDRDPFNSSVSYDVKNKKIVARSRVELLLPESESGVRQKVAMKYKFDAFFADNMCVVEITDINYLNNAKQNRNTLKQKIKAEDIITDKAIAIQDENAITRMQIKDNTLYYFNDLINSLERAFTQ